MYKYCEKRSSIVYKRGENDKSIYIYTRGGIKILFIISWLYVTTSKTLYIYLKKYII